MGTSGQRKQKANPGCKRVECRTCRHQAVSPPALSPLLSTSRPRHRLCDSHFREVRHIRLPRASKFLGSLAWGNQSRFSERGVAKNAFSDPREPAGFRKLFRAPIEVLFFRDFFFLNLEALADNKKRIQAHFRRTEIATNNQEAAGLGAVPGSPLCSRGPPPRVLTRCSSVPRGSCHDLGSGPGRPFPSRHVIRLRRLRAGLRGAHGRDHQQDCEGPPTPAW